MNERCESCVQVHDIEYLRKQAVIVDSALVLLEDMIFDEKNNCLTIFDTEQVFFQSQYGDRKYTHSLHKSFLRDLSNPSNDVRYFVDSYYLEFLIQACFYYKVDKLYNDLIDYFIDSIDMTIEVFSLFESTPSAVEKQFIIDVGNKKFREFLNEKSCF